VILVALATGIALPAGTEDGEEGRADRPGRIAVVTHGDNELESITRSELARIFLKQQTAWPNGERCIPIDQRGDSAIRKEFSRLVLKQSVYEVRRYWMQETMTGNAKPPVSLESAATVKKYLQKLKGAVAYVYLDEVDEHVKVLRVRDVEELATSAQDERPAPEEDAPGDTEAPVSPAEPEAVTP